MSAAPSFFSRFPSSKLLTRLAVAFLSPLFVVGLFEIGVELFSSVPDAGVPILLWGELDDADLYTKGGAFRTHLDWFWEPRPGAMFGGETINADGYRGDPVPRVKGSAFRIVALGDSSTMGFGVKDAEAWPRALERRLRSAGRDVEVVNLGVVGFTAYQGYRYYLGRARAYEPDLVLLAFGACNDQFRDSNGLTDREKARILASSAFRLREFGDRFVVVRWLRSVIAPPVEARPPDLDKAKPRVTPAELQEIYTTIHAEQRARGGLTAFISPPRVADAERELPETKLYTAAVETVARSTGAPLLDVYKAFRAREASEKTKLYIDSFHPTAAGHERYAEIVAGTLDSAGAIPVPKR